MNRIILDISQESPKALKYFLEYYTHDFENRLREIEFEELPFEFQLGVFISFFSSMSIDIQLYSTEQEALEEAVKEAFQTYEEYLFLDS